MPAAGRIEPNERIHTTPRWVVQFLALCCVGLIPWTIALAVTLPRHYLVADWPLAWTGFDFILFGCLSTTAWALWKQRQVAVLASMITSVLLGCDAWFDILTAIGGRCLMVSIATAMLAELPLAMLLALISIRLLQANAQVARGLEPNAALPSVWRTPLISARWADPPKHSTSAAESPAHGIRNDPDDALRTLDAEKGKAPLGDAAPFTGDRARAEAIAQEPFLRARRQVPGLLQDRRPVRALPPWMTRRLLINAALASSSRPMAERSPIGVRDCRCGVGAPRLRGSGLGLCRTKIEPTRSPTALALGDEQALGTHTDWTVEVAQHAGGQANTTWRDGRLRLQTDPRSDGLAVQVHSEFGIDEVPVG